jgi:hypothetical protein
MAARQTRIETLAPNDRLQQENWAQTVIGRMAAYPVGYDWTREPDGYRCNGGTHAVTDELLAEGIGGLFKVPQFQWAIKYGPYYPVDGAWLIFENGVWEDKTDDVVCWALSFELRTSKSLSLPAHKIRNVDF